jgi:RNase P/RNase MRP subunit POP5
MALELIFIDGLVDTSLNQRQILDALDNTFTVELGVFGSGAIRPGLKIIYWNPYTQIALVRVYRYQLRDSLAAITAGLRRIRDRIIIPRCLHVSATIRSAKQSMIQWAIEQKLDAQCLLDIRSKIVVKDEENDEEMS